MAFSDLVKRPDFWKHTLRIALMVLLLMTILALLMRSFSDILKFDIDAVITNNFADGKWVMFLVPKIIVAILYSMWMTSKNMK